MERRFKYQYHESASRWFQALASSIRISAQLEFGEDDSLNF